MNKEEFIRRKRIAEGRARTLDITTTVIFFAALMALWVFTKWQENHRDHIPVWPIPCLLLLLFTAAFAVAPNSYWNMRRRARRNGLNCPSCDGVLLGPVGEIAVASGNCPQCGETLFREEENTGAIPEAIPATVADDSSQAPASALTPTGLECPGTWEEFQLRERAVQREAKSPLSIVLMLAPTVLMITAVAMSIKFKANPAMGRPYAICALLILAISFAAPFILRSWQKRRIREFGLACPGCHGTLAGMAGQLAKATGCCCHCGGHLFHDVPFRLGESLEKRQEFADRKRAVDRAWKSARRILIPVAALGLGMILVACVFIPPRGEFHNVPLENVQTGIIFAAIAVMYGTGIPVFLRMKRLRKKNGLACLSCRKPLTHIPLQMAVATGVCSHCGGSIFAGEA